MNGNERNVVYVVYQRASVVKCCHFRVFLWYFSVFFFGISCAVVWFRVNLMLHKVQFVKLK